MEYNELTYLETFGSLPVFYPVIRYFHAKSQTHKDYENAVAMDEVDMLEFLNHMMVKYRPAISNEDIENQKVSRRKDGEL